MKHALVLAAAVLLALSSVSADTIDFDDVPNDTVITTQYAGVTFSSDPGLDVVTYALAFLYPTSLPNVIAAGTGADPVYIDFAPPVDSVQLAVADVHNSGPVIDINVFENGILAGTETVIGDGNSTTVHTADLTAYSNVTRIEVINTTMGADNIIYDDLVYNPVPVELMTFTIE